jgi:hypothetical protein
VKRTYDQKQAAAVLSTCSKCGVQVYATGPTVPYTCILCRDKERA